MSKFSRKIGSTAIMTCMFTFTAAAIAKKDNSAYALSNDTISTIKMSSGTSGVGLYSSRTFKSQYRLRNGDKVEESLYGKISGGNSTFNIQCIETGAADIRVFVGKNKSKLNNYKDKIAVDGGSKEDIYVRLYSSKQSADDDFLNEYKISIERGEPADNDEDGQFEEDKQENGSKGDVYLKFITLLNEGTKFEYGFEKNTTIYNLNVDESVGYLRIKAFPEYEGNKVKINDDTLDKSGDNRFKKDVSLNMGKNVIKITVIGDKSEKREYFFNVVRGKAEAVKTTRNTPDITEDTSDEDVTNSEVSANSDNVVKSQGWCYRKSDGTFATGWTQVYGEWYYFGQDGVRKTGWIKDTNGKWYYLNPQTGAMARNTVVNGYKIGNDGVYINN